MPQKYRVDETETDETTQQETGWAVWMGGRTLARIRGVPVFLDGVKVKERATVYPSGEPDTFFSLPGNCTVRLPGGRKYLRGVIFYADPEREGPEGEAGWVFHARTRP